MLEDPELKFMVIRSRIIICINNYKFVIIFGDPDPNFISWCIIIFINNNNSVNFEDPEPNFRIRDALNFY